jgi:hypothetical protein
MVSKPLAKHEKQRANNIFLSLAKVHTQHLSQNTNKGGEHEEPLKQYETLPSTTCSSTCTSSVHVHACGRSTKQCMRMATLKRVRATIVAVEKQ